MNSVKRKVFTSDIAFLISAFIAFMLFWGLPDLDIVVLGIGRHRNFLFHSVIIPLFLYIFLSSKKENIISFMKNGIILGSSLSISIHLLIDIIQPKSIDFIIITTLIKGTLLDDNIWLGINGIIGLIIGTKANKNRIENIIDIKRKSRNN